METVLSMSDAMSRANTKAQNIILVCSKGKALAGTIYETGFADMFFYLESSLASERNFSSPQEGRAAGAEVVLMCPNQVMHV